MLRYICSLLILAISIPVLAQEAEEAIAGKPRGKYVPYDIKLGFNAIRSGRTALNSELSTQEGTVEFSFEKLSLIGDFGVESHTFGDGYSYTNDGSYFRIGIDRNFAKRREEGNVISLGVRYARAYFTDELSYPLDVGFGEQDYTANNDLNARWLEIVFNVRGRLVSNLYMGFTMRWQMSRKINNEGELLTWVVPGHGKTKRRNSTQFDYYIMWRIPFKN